MHALFTLEDVFKTLIHLEKTGFENYTKLSTLTQYPQIKTLFERLAKQERAHQKLYTEYQNKHIVFESSVPYLSEHSEDADEQLAASNANSEGLEYSEYIQALLNTSVSFMRSNEVPEDYAQCFQLAIGLERDTIMLLQELRQMLAEEHQGVITSLIAEERKHLTYLYGLMSHLTAQ
jgi:rubrerythrin